MLLNIGAYRMMAIVTEGSVGILRRNPSDILVGTCVRVSLSSVESQPSLAGGCLF